MNKRTRAVVSVIASVSMLAPLLVSFIAPASALAALAPAPGVCATMGTPFLTITQPITEPDSGTSGNWANDTLTEKVNVWLATDNSGTFCANGNTTNGTFTTTGPNSPQNGAPLASGITGTFTGGETWVLPAGTATTTSASSLTLAADNSATGSQFNNWQSQVFTTTAGASTYAFTYVTPNNGTWTNADATSGGNSGDITGVPTASSVTVAATNVTAADATLNGMNGDVAAGSTGLWVATSTFSTTSTTPPPGVYTETLPGVAANTAYSAQLSSVSGLPAITPNTTYYFVAWSDVDGTWTPGAVMQFTTGAPVATTAPTTLAATAVTSSDATLNGMNGSTAADQSSFWVSTSTFSTPPNGSPFPAGVYSTPLLGPVAANAAYAAQLSSVAGLPAVTPNTTYYVAAWTEVDGTWTPGAVMQFTTASSTGTSTPTTGTIGGIVTGTATGTLAVTSIDTIKGSATADGTFGNGWEYLFHITIPTNEQNLAMKFSDWFNAVASSTLPVANDMEISSAQASSTSPIVLTAANLYSTPALHMITDLSSTTPGIQVTVDVKVAVPLNTTNGSYTTSYGVQTLP